MNRRQNLGWLAAAGLAVSAFGLPAQGQLQPRREQPGQGGAPITVTPPRPSPADRAPTLWMILMAALLGAGVVGTALIPSKRGHQD